MPKMVKTEHGDTIRWGLFEKITGGVLTGVVLAACMGIFGVYVDNQTLKKDVARHETVINERILNEGQYNTDDAANDRSNRATHEASVMNALSNIQKEQSEQRGLLSNVDARMTSIERDIQNGREERIRLDEKIEKLRN